MTNKRKFIVNDTKEKKGINVSRWLLISGSILCGVSIVTTVLAVTLPYWIYVSDVLETTVAGLTDDTDVTYFYGLLRYCIRMKATHLDIDECNAKDYASLSYWEQTTLLTLVVSTLLSVIAIMHVIFNLRCWNKVFLLIAATVSALASGACQAVGVSLYQIKASVLVLDIGGLTTASFEPGFFGVAFWLGFTSAATSLVAGLLLMLGTFTWKKPKTMRKNIYKTTVRATRCPYKGRQPAVISITQM